MLLAKSITNRTQLSYGSYCGHTVQVMRAATAILDAIGSDLVVVLPIANLNQFRETVLLGSYLHDSGKANGDFQALVQGAHLQQKLRHEAISVLLALRLPKLRQWLEQGSGDLMGAACAAVSHHLKVDANTAPKDGPPLQLCLHDRDFKAYQKIGAIALLLPRKLPLPNPKPKQLETTELTQLFEVTRQELMTYAAGLSERERLELAVVKALVVAADVAGSALPAKGVTPQKLPQGVEHDETFSNIRSTQDQESKPKRLQRSHCGNFQNWILKSLGTVLTPKDQETLLHAKLKKGQSLHKFQNQAAASDARVTLVEAGTGLGKTLIAYIFKQAVGRKLFFCYPTTGTATQGFADYLYEVLPEAALVHSRYKVDFETILSNGDNTLNPQDEIEALRVWPQKIVTCTVDTVLGLLQNYRKSLYAFPAFVKGAFVFDEVHSYDAKLFGELLVFLRIFKVPVLLLSATLPPTQKSLIENTLASQGEELRVVEGPPEVETLRRYRIHTLDKAQDAWSAVQHALSQKQKILWVTNSVREAQSLYQQAKKFFPKALLYHGRYRYFDRVQHHQSVVDAFKANGPVLAIATQVAELSLDLSCDLLVTACAPATALIQRLGRCNRSLIFNSDNSYSLASGGICDVLVYPWSGNPYKEADLETGRQLIKQLEGRDISQTDLSVVLAQQFHQLTPVLSSSWLDDGWHAHVEPAREAGVTLTVVLQQDLNAIKDYARANRVPQVQAAQRFSVPILLTWHSVKDWASWEKLKFYRVAPASAVGYDPDIGAWEV